MKKNKDTFIAIIAIGLIIFWIFFSMMPKFIDTDERPLSEFSVKRALNHVSRISENPHYVGSQNHTSVAAYLESELEKMGLETRTAEGTTLTDWGNLVKSKNILARIDGSGDGKALLLLSHYDSAPHSASRGAADDGAGVASILEGIRAFLHNKTQHANDVIILFSDAEELGLNGAAQFVMQDGWAKDVGVVLNFEARGTAGPSYMLMEVTGGNAKMVDAFSKAGVGYPVANSLMYSIYKMLPNDTDLTVFREQGSIQGFNFAFIDDHYNYHTAQDDFQHLDHRSLAHQSHYLMPLLAYLSNADLSALKSAEDHVYFSTPVGFFDYPFSWNTALLIVTGLLFLFFVFIGLGKRTLEFPAIGKGFALLFGALVAAGLVGFFGWKLIMAIYPSYTDIQQGFTYNGHAYILAFVLLAVAISLLFYGRRQNEAVTMSYTVAPLFLWFVINILVVVYLPGAAFFIIPLFCAVLMLAFFVLTQRNSLVLNLVLALPTLMLIVPLIWMFPIGLGLSVIFACAILTVLTFGLLLPLLGTMEFKGAWSFVLILVSIAFMIRAHLNSDYEPGKAKPNSLVYYLDAEKDLAYWGTYDANLDGWTKKYLGENPGVATALNTNKLYSKYNAAYTYASQAPVVTLENPEITFLLDSIIGTQRYFKIRVVPKRKVNRYDIFADPNLIFHNLKANGATMVGQKGSAFPRNGKKLLSYYVVDNEPLELQFSIVKTKVLDMELLETSFDLLTDPKFNMAQRPAAMMPAPFVLTDAVIVRHKIRQTQRVPIVPVTILPAREPVALDTLAIEPDVPENDGEL
jgi:hypothetical protein